MIKVDTNLFIFSKNNRFINKNNDKTGSKTINFSGDSSKPILPISYNSDVVNYKNFNKTVIENYFKLAKNMKPDIFQLAAAENLYNGNDVIVTAPTGTGKTAIANYIITKNLKEGKRTFYTAPLKALSNEKYKNFQNIYGKENVGIITGDIKYNTNAPIIMMTTEIYRNMVFQNKFGKGNKFLSNLGTVVFDELHYLGDEDRGRIWEESIILSDPKTQLLSLSATIKNNKEIANWLASVKQKNGKAEIVDNLTPFKKYKVNYELPIHTVLIDVPVENRHVPLYFEEFDAEAKTFSNVQNQSRTKNNVQNECSIPSLRSFKDAVEILNSKKQLPAIFFVFSKKESGQILDYLKENGPVLTSKEEQIKILEIIDKYKNEGKYLGASFDVYSLLSGYSVHNSGLLPTQKELIEELFQKKLLKVCIATETLSAGINMPAKTTVISSLRKPSNKTENIDGKRKLSANEFHQMAGRAGRRGIDEVGYCYTMPVNERQKKECYKLIESSTNNISSHLKPDFSFIANYYYYSQDKEAIAKIFEKSFYTYDNTGGGAERKKDKLLNYFDNKTELLKNSDFIDKDNNLTPKGFLLTKLSGYEQIPVINAIYNKKFINMNPVELAGAVASLANITANRKNANEDSFIGNQFIEDSDLLSECDDSKLNLFNTELEEEIDKYNLNMEKIEGEDYFPLGINRGASINVYEFARLNHDNKDSINNWKNLYSEFQNTSINDEGTLFKEMNTTLDLLKQMKQIVKYGEKTCENKDDFEYYENLYNTLNSSIKLLLKPPVLYEY